MEGCLFSVQNLCACDMYCGCEQPGCRRKVETPISCRNLLNNKCCLTTIIHHKERKDRDKFLICKKQSLSCYGGRILYIYIYIRALRNTLICKSPALPKHTSHGSVINKHRRRDLKCQCDSALISYFLLRK